MARTLVTVGFDVVLLASSTFAAFPWGANVVGNLRLVTGLCSANVPIARVGCRNYSVQVQSIDGLGHLLVCVFHLLPSRRITIIQKAKSDIRCIVEHY